VGVERVGLEHHGHATVLRVEVVHAPPADHQVAVADGFKPRDHPQRRRLAAARRADKDDEGAVGDVQVDPPHRDLAAVKLDEVLEDHLGHGQTRFTAGSAHRCSGQIAYQSGRPGSRSYM
jgi:hypothetical protein